MGVKRPCHKAHLVDTTFYIINNRAVTITSFLFCDHYCHKMNWDKQYYCHFQTILCHWRITTIWHVWNWVSWHCRRTPGFCGRSTPEMGAWSPPTNVATPPVPASLLAVHGYQCHNFSRRGIDNVRKKGQRWSFLSVASAGTEHILPLCRKTSISGSGTPLQRQNSTGKESWRRRVRSALKLPHCNSSTSDWQIGKPQQTSSLRGLGLGRWWWQQP